MCQELKLCGISHRGREGWRGTKHHPHKRSSAAAEVLRGVEDGWQPSSGLFARLSRCEKESCWTVGQEKPGSEESSDPGSVVFRQNVSDDVQT